MSEYVASTMWGEVKRTLFNGEWGIVVMSAIGFVVLLALLFNPELSMIKSPSNYEMLGNRKPAECVQDTTGYCTANFYVK